MTRLWASQSGSGGNVLLVSFHDMLAAKGEVVCRRRWVCEGETAVGATS